MVNEQLASQLNPIYVPMATAQTGNQAGVTM